MRRGEFGSRGATEVADTKLNVGFVGAGRIADLHALAYGSNGRGRIFAVCTPDSELNNSRAREWGAQETFTDYRDLLEDPRIDAVEILTPHHLHEEIAVAALRAGKPVSLQKPMARSVAESMRIVAASLESGVSLRVFENFRHYPPFLFAKHLIDDGVIGEPQSQRISVIHGSGPGWEVPDSAWAWRYRPDLCGGGPDVFDHGYHIFSIARFLLGSVEEVHAWILTSEGLHGVVDRPALISWKHELPNRLGCWDSVGSPELYVPSKYYTCDERVQIVGERGIIWINHCSGLLLSDAPVVLYRDGTTTEYHTVESDWGASFRIGGQEWHDHLLDGTPCETSAEEGLEVMRFVEAAHQSAASGMPIRPDSIGTRKSANAENQRPS
jgi:predicted dehydrogenase